MSPEAIPESEELTPKLAEKLLSDSFQLSQGDAFLQDALLWALFQVRKQWRMNPQSTQYQQLEKSLRRQKVVNALHKFRMDPEKHPAPSIPTTKAETKKVWNEQTVDVFLSYLSGSNIPSYDFREEYLERFIERDLYFFHVGQEEPDMPPRERSHLIDFILTGRRRIDLQTDAFREVCEWLGRYIRSRDLTARQDRDIQEIQNWHNKTPGPKGPVDILKQLKRAR